jgi:hypothetical protein
MLCAEVSMQGERRIAYYSHKRIASFQVGWKRQLRPDIGVDAGNLFLFDADRRLAALPLSRREKVSEGRGWNQEQMVLTPCAYLLPILKEPAKYADPANVPLTEEQESRLAWLGIELQGLNPELARANNVSEHTNDGRTGGIVTYVYPDSPEAKAGVEPGWILLRLHVDTLPNPIEVRVEERFRGSFPWEQLDNVPEQAFDRIPEPWPPRENFMSRSLTDVGFGTKFTAEYFVDGQIVKKEFVVSVAPPHFDAAAKHKSEKLGLTVRELTYEVRRYFQKTSEDPGVIISKIEAGSKASVGGLKPYEMITHVNDQPVATAAEFEKAVAGQAEIRLAVKRMAKGRVVKIQFEPPKETPKEAPQEPAKDE